MQLSVAYLTLGTSWLPLGIVLMVLAVVAIGAALWHGVLDWHGVLEEESSTS